MFESLHIVHSENTMNQIWKSKKQYLWSLYYIMSYFHDRKRYKSAVGLLIQIFKYTTRETLFFHVNKKKCLSLKDVWFCSKTITIGTKTKTNPFNLINMKINNTYNCVSHIWNDWLSVRISLWWIKFNILRKEEKDRKV